MALCTSYALLFAFLVGRCALGAVDDVDGDSTVETYSNRRRAHADAHRDLDQGMTSSTTRLNGVGNLRDTGDVDAAIPTAGSSGGRSQGIVGERAVVVTETFKVEDVPLDLDVDPMPTWPMGREHNPPHRADGATTHGPATRANDYLGSGMSFWPSADVVSGTFDFARRMWVPDDQRRRTTSNIAAGATSNSFPKDTKLTCAQCSKHVPTKFGLERHLTHHCKGPGPTTSRSLPKDTNLACAQCGKQRSRKCCLGRHLTRPSKGRGQTTSSSVPEATTVRCGYCGNPQRNDESVRLHKNDYLGSGTSTWPPADIVSCTIDFARQKLVPDDQHRRTTSNVGAGATTSSSFPKDPHFTCPQCGKQLSSKAVTSLPGAPGTDNLQLGPAGHNSSVRFLRRSAGKR
ncbi:hypothetical protein PBRA_005439 [Plasmodiophora brassicae]|uniref:C2H2-type domain-containing protein n=1 Tax=Plasmodiophora brassicae TaxID=37360 RepID=A0A0G4INU1_PLABS|nr:hypothetical protein PBRA_005439 [Plasmodiophora brassicae]